MASLSVTLVNRRSEIEGLHRLIEAFGGRHGVPDNVLFSLNLALDEIVTNIIVHGHTDSAEHNIHIAIALDDDVLEATVRDDAPPFNPVAVPPVDLSAPAAGRPVGGLGVHLVRSVMDHVDYRRDGAQNILVIRKSIRSSDIAPTDP
jgi:anti-sigma regulatory factor (Ser/Thr protein kinase)